MISASVSAPTETKTRTKRRKIPAYLVRETIDGVEFYYPGFRQVLNKQKKLDEIMGDGGLQFFLKDFLVEVLKSGLDKKLYRVAGGELGFHATLRNSRKPVQTWGEKSNLVFYQKQKGVHCTSQSALANG